MATLHPGACGKCRRCDPVSVRVEPEQALRIVVLNRRPNICPSCFDAEAETAGVRYKFMDLDAMSALAGVSPAHHATA